MKISNIDFDVTDWALIERAEHKGETGVAYWRTSGATLFIVD